MCAHYVTLNNVQIFNSHSIGQACYILQQLSAIRQSALHKPQEIQEIRVVADPRKLEETVEILLQLHTALL